MERIKINEPQRYAFSTEIKVAVTDLNYGNHVGNHQILAYVHEARVQYLQYVGFKSELDVNGFGLIMADVAINYKAEIFYPNTLVAYVQAFGFNKIGFDIVYKICIKNADGTETVAAIAKTGMMAFDYEKRKKISIDEQYMQNFLSK